jgi:uncharacterized protein YnzC (UPF0291/DUF896 family)
LTEHEKRIQRINELAAIAKNRGLTEAEIAERDRLRKEYLEVFRGNFKRKLENIKFVDEDGNEIKRKK